jgi:hypothetical protein
MTVYAMGIDKDPGFVYFLQEALRQGADVCPINIKAVVHDGAWRFSIPDDGGSFMSVGDNRIELDPQASYYCRIYDLAAKQPSQQDRARWQNFISGVYAWLEVVPGIVVNRPNAAIDNFVKPLHEHHLASHGVRVPESLTSSRKDALIDFCERGPTIVKSVSGARSDAVILTPALLETYEPRQGPLHVQRLVGGFDVRAHVVGSVVHAEKIVSPTVDYRSARGTNTFCAHILPDTLQEILVVATRSFGLTLAGWDFKVDSAGTYWCLEANSLPGYFNYDRRCNGAITISLLNLLTGERRVRPRSLEGNACR